MSDQTVIRRDFPAELEAGDGRTLDVRIVPYGKPAEVSDGGPLYREEWVEGAFDDQLVAGHRLQVFLNFEHERGIGGVIGDGVSLRSQPDGLHGSFEILDGPDGNKALDLVNRGKLRGISLEAFVKKTVPSADGIVRRVKAHLRNVALCRTPAYEDAQVLAVREAPLIDKELLPTDMDAETVELCRQLGVKLPERYRAHPVETDTPAPTGTSEDGTRQVMQATTSEESWVEHKSELSKLARLIDEREHTQTLHEGKLGDIEKRDDKTLGDADTAQITAYRERIFTLDSEIKELAETVEHNNTAIEQSQKIRKALAGAGGVDGDEDGVVYRTMASYARDVIITGNGREAAKIKGILGDNSEIDRAESRLQLLKRTPANTLSSNVAGLTPQQHIAQIFQVINDSRPLVASAQQTALVRGVISYPRIDTKPVVAVQTTQKTEAGNTALAVSMQTATASTYLGGGDLSWQAINWSTPNALDLWFQLAAADYALKTEQDAAQVLQHSAFSNNIASTLAATPTFAQFMTAVGAGYAEVFANSGRLADTIYMAPDRFGYLLGLTSDAFTQFVSVGQSGVGPLSVVVSRGMDAGVVVVGDRAGLLVAETAGAPVELRVVAPAIGGVEVGIIGAFEAVAVDNGAFSMLTTAS